MSKKVWDSFMVLLTCEVLLSIYLYGSEGIKSAQFIFFFFWTVYTAVSENVKGTKYALDLNRLYGFHGIPKRSKEFGEF